MPQHELIARRLAIVPTTRCTLNCKMCGDFLFTGGVKRRDIPYEEVCLDIDACFDLFDHVTWLQFVGGEVYIYRDFAKLLRYVQKYRDRFDRLVIETNATVAPMRMNERPCWSMAKICMYTSAIMASYPINAMNLSRSWKRTELIIR